MKTTQSKIRDNKEGQLNTRKGHLNKTLKTPSLMSRFRGKQELREEKFGVVVLESLGMRRWRGGDGLVIGERRQDSHQSKITEYSLQPITLKENSV